MKRPVQLVRNADQPGYPGSICSLDWASWPSFPVYDFFLSDGVVPFVGGCQVLVCPEGVRGFGWPPPRLRFSDFAPSCVRIFLSFNFLILLGFLHGSSVPPFGQFRVRCVCYPSRHYDRVNRCRNDKIVRYLFRFIWFYPDIQGSRLFFHFVPRKLNILITTGILNEFSLHILDAVVVVWGKGFDSPMYLMYITEPRSCIFGI